MASVDGMLLAAKSAADVIDIVRSMSKAIAKKGLRLTDERCEVWTNQRAETVKFDSMWATSW